LSPTALAIRSQKIKPCILDRAFEDSEKIRNGQLPELILESILAFIGVKKIQIRLIE